MNRFTADYSSSSESAPHPRSNNPRRKQFLSHAPELASTTPLAPPPSSIFGSSRAGTGVSKLQFSRESISSSAHPTPPFARPQSLPWAKNGITARPQSRPFHSSVAATVSDFYEGEEDESYEDDGMEEDDNEYSNVQRNTDSVGVDAKLGGRNEPSLMRFDTNSNRRSYARPSMSRSMGLSATSQLPSKGQEKIIPGLARDLSTRSAPAPLQEVDEVILQTEQSLRELEEQVENAQEAETLQEVLSMYSHHLVAEWRQQTDIQPSGLERGNIGPPSSATGVEKAYYVASLLLGLYHPPPSNQGLQASQLSRIGSSAAPTVPIPQILLEWLDGHHSSYVPLYKAVLAHRPNCAAHDLFWDAVLSLTMRGNLAEAMHLLADADFQYAATAVDDASKGQGYRGVQLQMVQEVIYRARQVLNACPAVQDGDWTVDGPDWDTYRKRVVMELERLVQVANDHEEDDDDDDTFQAEHFGIRKPAALPLLRGANKSKSTLPRTIYQTLKILYSVLLGGAQEIIAQSQDWLEATAALTVWWDGSRSTRVAQWSFDVSRASDPDAEEDLENPYKARLRDAFLCVTDPEASNSFQINAMSTVEVGLACVLQGHIPGALSMIRSSSQCIAAAVAEVGSCAGWIITSKSGGPSGLDQDDLMVLSYAPSKTDMTKDDVLLSYAEALFDRQELQADQTIAVEGWELAFTVASRFDDQDLARSTINGFLDELEAVDDERVAKVFSLCTDLGLQEEARKVSEKFGDHLVSNTMQYGTALISYAKSHATHKIRQLVDLLNSYCLVQSKAYPIEGEMDEDLKELVSNPKSALSNFVETDPEAAEALQFNLVGYACLRKFYNLRDDEASFAKAGRLRPIARKLAAAKALIAAINSAGDSIYGGLYDAERQSAIQVDGLLTLLGEASALLARKNEKRVLTLHQMYALLAAIEDLQTVNSRVFGAIEECLQASLQNYHGNLPPSPHAMLKKSMSSGTNSNFSFSMMGSEMLRSKESIGGKSLGSAVLVGGDGKAEVNRGWDWRSSFKDQSTTGADVLRYLRTGIAKELSLAELDSADVDTVY